MKKIALVILLGIVFINANAQKTKGITVVKTGTSCKFSIDGIINYNGDTPTDTSYYIAAMDEQYTMIYEPIILKSGSPQELYDFLKQLNIIIGKEEMKTTVPFDGCSIYVTKFFGVRGAIISNANWTTRSYCSIDYVKLSMLTDKLKSYCVKHNINLNL